MITDTQIRNLVMSRPVRLKYLMLTNEQRQVLRLVGELKQITSADLLQYRRKWSIQGASNVLNLLWRKRYLTRVPNIRTVGGIEYMYSVHHKINLLD